MTKPTIQVNLTIDEMWLLIAATEYLTEHLIERGASFDVLIGAVTIGGKLAGLLKSDIRLPSVSGTTPN